MSQRTDLTKREIAAIQAYRDQHPGSSSSQVARALGLDVPTATIRRCVPYATPGQTAKLRALFESLRTRYYPGRRASRYVVAFKHLGDGSTFARRFCAGRIDRPTRTIYVEEFLGGEIKYLRRTIVHELAHVRAIGHGAPFRAELRRVARMGCREAVTELRELPRTRQEEDFRALEDSIAYEIEARAGFLDQPFAEYVAETWPPGYRDFVRTFPWARRAYAKVRRAAATGRGGVRA